jgi:hypothetical protein
MLINGITFNPVAYSKIKEYIVNNETQKELNTAIKKQEKEKIQESIELNDI